MIEVRRLLRRCALLSIVLISSICFSQDIHFSQFYASPLTLNPALTGFSNGTYRATAIYRNQWRSVTQPYVTYSASYDMRLLQGKLPKDIFGVGGMVFSDKSGDGDLGILHLMASVAYHKRIGKNQYLALGIQGGYVQKSLQFAQLTFPNQFSGTDFDPTIPNQEPYTGGNISYLDFNVGLMWHAAINDGLGLFAGVSWFHLTQPQESFLGATSNKIPARYLGHGGARIKLSDRIWLTPNFVYMYQDKAQELNLGTSVEYHFNDKNNMVAMIGGWYRLVDAFILSAGYEFKSIRMGVSYDFNASQLTPASHARGAFEISLVYTGILNTSVTREPILVPCPKML